ncbi:MULTISPECIES: RNA-directed DNA polymerase [unclassified Mesobacillus]|uniref:RNA-directed DNA polymerase n=1 Tax=unclassified Mesobacillus TaxID=2675270 RepID=UPI00203EDE23|nr:MULTISPECIES: RNA-directed DNA polymerase [unclassified Mesobacillus]MCM3122887.1 RNA-directed DNA polymerase [Mesobacillus sp. MER 33]MCM3233630.1 RNA-directed DNA polymerase [Mesobacillus sp. MER 48]
MSEKKEIAKKIISSGYFASQIPGEFKSTSLSENIDILDLTKSRLSKEGLNKWCKLIDFSIPKTENFRRIISVPHPLHYILLARLIEDNWGDLEVHFSKSQFSLTTPQVTKDNIEPKYKMSEKINRRIHNLVLKRYILQADITRYYPSIYTHSIPWALHTKEVAKANQRDDGYYGNVIDRFVRNLQDGQTVGIPIGPVASLIIQEIVGTTIDVDFKREYGDGLVGYRYTDDMEYYFGSSEEAERAQNILNKILKNYGLDLNNSKTRVIKIPQVLESEWLYYFKKYEFRRNKKDKRKSIYLQHTDIKEFFSTAFRYKIQLDEKGILNYAVKVLRGVVIHRENWDIFESLLLQSILVDSSIIPTVFETIEGYQYRGYPLNDERIKDFINVLIKENVELKNDFEVSWALSFAAKLDISIEEDVSKLLLKNDNAIINILVMVLNSKNLLKGALDFSYYESFLTEESLYDSNWLFYYECCIHGWLGKDKNNQHIKNDKFFVQLLNNNVSFVNPTHSKVLEEVKHSIISLCLKHYQTNMKTMEARDIMSKVIEDYSFSIEANLIEELNNELLNEINKIKTAEGTVVETEDAERRDEETGETEVTEGTDEETGETEGTDEETGETEGTDEETGETEGTDEETGETEGTDEETGETEGTDEETEEKEGSDGEIEEDEETKEVPEIVRAQGSDNNWLYYFLTTNVNKAFNIRNFEIEEEY